MSTKTKLDDMDRGIVLNFGSENEITLGDYIDHKINEALKNLRLEVNTKTTSNYVGDNGHGSLYRDSTTVNIQLIADIADGEYSISDIEFDID